MSATSPFRRPRPPSSLNENIASKLRTHYANVFIASSTESQLGSCCGYDDIRQDIKACHAADPLHTLGKFIMRNTVKQSSNQRRGKYYTGLGPFVYYITTVGASLRRWHPGVGLRLVPACRCGFVLNDADQMCRRNQIGSSRNLTKQIWSSLVCDKSTSASATDYYTDDRRRCSRSSKIRACPGHLE